MRNNTFFDFEKLVTVSALTLLITLNGWSQTTNTKKSSALLLASSGQIQVGHDGKVTDITATSAVFSMSDPKTTAQYSYGISVDSINIVPASTNSMRHSIAFAKGATSITLTKLRPNTQYYIYPYVVNRLSGLKKQTKSLVNPNPFVTSYGPLLSFRTAPAYRNILKDITLTRTQGLKIDTVTFVFSTPEDWRIYKLDSLTALAKSLPDASTKNDSVKLLFNHANTRYYYKVVKNNQESVIMSETALPVKGQTNFRDLGGIVTEDGHNIKWGKLFRSGALNKLTLPDREYVESAGIKVEIDFRTDSELVNSKDSLPKDLELVRLPISTPPSPDSINCWLNTKSIIALDTMFIPLYRSLVNDPVCQKQYTRFLNQLATTGKATVYHCSAGKDRTGFATVLLLSALGVDRQTIISNYLETNLYISNAANSYIRGINRNYNDNRGELLHRSLTVNYQYIKTSLDIIDNTKGGMKAYLYEKLKMTPELIQALKKKYLDNYPK
jgi:protein-tyrosine phosphatase